MCLRGKSWKSLILNQNFLNKKLNKAVTLGLAYELLSHSIASNILKELPQADKEFFWGINELNKKYRKNQHHIYGRHLAIG